MCPLAAGTCSSGEDIAEAFMVVQPVDQLKIIFILPSKCKISPFQCT